MVLHIFLIILFILFVLTCLMFEFDFFEPAIILVIGYILTTLSAIYNEALWQFKLHWNSVGLLLIGICSFIMTSYLTKRYVVKRYNTHLNLQELKEIHIQNLVFYIMLLANIVVFILYYLEVLDVVESFGKSIHSISALIANYRTLSYYSNDSANRVSSIVNQLSKIIPAMTFISLFIFINNYIATNKIKQNLKYLLPLVVFFAYAMISGGRMPLIRLSIAGLFLFSIISSYNKRNNLKNSIILLKRALLSFVILVIVFYGLKFLLGRSSQENFSLYITRYLGGSLQLFDLFVENPNKLNSEFGAETFSGIYEMLAKFGVENNIIKGLEWRSAPSGYAVGNVYTAIRRYYSDFGIFGIIFCQSMLAVVYTVFYQKCKHSSLGTDKQRLRIIIYAASLYPIFLNSIEDVFYISMITIGYIIQLIIFKIMFKIMFRVKIVGDK